MATNKSTGQKYIGKTVHSLSRRMKWHIATAKRGDGYRFHNALRKHGASSFQWDVLATSDCDEALCSLERAYITAWNTINSGYNLTQGGDGVTGRTPETMEKIAIFHRGRKRSKETCRRISVACAGMQRRLGAKLSDETKAKIAAALTGRKLSKAQRDKIGNYMRGRPKTEEQKRKMSEARRLWWANRQAVKNLAAASTAAKEQVLL